MPCIEEKIPGGTRIVCARGRGWYGASRQRCAYCKDVATRLCDGAIDGLAQCSKPLCWRHTHQPPSTKNLDFCPEHKPAANLVKAAR